MGTFSIWHAVIVLIVLAFFAIPVVAIARTRADDLRGRAKVWKVFGAIFLLVVAQSIAQSALPPGQVAPILLGSMIVGVFISYWAARTLAARCQDLSWSRWVALVQLIPLVNLMFFIVLGTLRSRQPASAQGDAAMAEA